MDNALCSLPLSRVMPRPRKIHARLNFPSPLLVAEEVLGRPFEATIGKQPVTITFPRLADGNLRPPFDLHLSHDDEYSYGHPDQIPGDWSVTAVAASLDLTAASPLDLEMAETMKVAAAFDSWFGIAKQWICARNALRYRDPDLTRESVLRGWDQDQAILWGSGVTVGGVTIGERRLGGDSVQVADGFRRASQGKPIPLPWQFLVRAESPEDTRRAIVDSATAVEVALAESIRATFSQAGIPDRQTEAVINNAGGLMGLARIAEADDVTDLGSLNSLRKSVAEPRNRALHRGEEPSAADVKDAVRCARSMLENLHPLDFPARTTEGR